MRDPIREVRLSENEVKKMDELTLYSMLMATKWLQAPHESVAL